MSTNRTSIEERVMANVGVIYSARKVTGPTALKLYVFVAAMLGLWRLVWVTRIEENFLNVMHGGVVSVGNYVLYALMHTHPSVQATLAVALVAFVLLVSDFSRAATPRQHLAY